MCLFRSNVFHVIVMLSICTVMFCDSSAKKNDNNSLLMLAVASSDKPVTMEFSIDGDTMSWLDCTFVGVTIVGVGSFYTVTGREGSETLELGCGKGSVGNHNGSSSASNEYIKYTMEGNDYYGRTSDGGSSTIYVSKSDAAVMEGTFYGSVCNASEGCLTIRRGSFHASMSPK
jgi:hypothetical protein